MKSPLRRSFLGDQGRIWPVLFAVAVILLFGCQAREAPLNPGIASFKQELKSCIDSLAATLIEPVARKDIAGIKAALANVESPAVKLCRMCPFEIGVLNPVGATLAEYPVRGDGKPKDYSTYELVKKAISTKRIQQQGLFLPDGSKVYLVCAPLVSKDVLIGLVAIAISSEEAKKRWGLTEKEFLALNFNI